MGQSKARRLVVAVLALIMALTMSVPAFAATSPSGGGDTAKAATVTKVSTDAYYASKSIKVSFTGKNAAKYKVAYRVAGGKWQYTTTTNKKSFTIKGLKQGKLYQVKVAGINKAGKVGKYSKAKYRYLGKSKSFKATSPKAKTMKVTWKKATGATGYKIYYSKNSDMSGYKIKTVKGGSKTSATISGLTKGKTYYVRVRPYKVYSGSTYLGVILSKKTVKIK